MGTVEAERARLQAPFTEERIARARRKAAAGVFVIVLAWASTRAFDAGDQIPLTTAVTVVASSYIRPWTELSKRRLAQFLGRIPPDPSLIEPGAPAAPAPDLVQHPQDPRRD